jgi:predicted alpha/beta-hydrolase family hydrolase
VKLPGKRFETELIRGWLHEPAGAPCAAMALFHGAGSDCESALMVAVAGAFCDAGYVVLRGDLPFRQERKNGPPRMNAQLDREGIRRAAEELRKIVPGVTLFLAGHSYGGRQATMLAAEDPAVAEALMLLSYPLHPPRQPAQLRTSHFPALHTPALFVHGTRDPFGTIEEMKTALALIPAKTKLVALEKAAHSLPPSVAASLPGYITPGVQFQPWP